MVGSTSTNVSPSNGAPGRRPWRPALVSAPAGRPGIYDAIELLLFAAVLALALATPPRDALGRPNAPFKDSFQQVTGGGMCWFKRWTGRPCSGCGLTRGFVQLAHGHPLEAVRLNPLAPFVFLWISWRVVELVVLNAFKRRLLHGVPQPWVWRYYAACGIGFVFLALVRLIFGAEGV